DRGVGAQCVELGGEGDVPRRHGRSSRPSRRPESTCRLHHLDCRSPPPRNRVRILSPAKFGEPNFGGEVGPVRAGTVATARRARVLPLLGPAFVAAIAYVDPGNVAANLT